MKWTSETSMYLYISTSDTGTKFEISGVMWQVAPDSKIYLVSCKLSQKSLLGLSTLEETHSIDVYILCDSLYYVLLSIYFSTLVDPYAKVLTFPNLHSSELSFPTFRVGTICDPVILQSTYEACIFISIFMLSKLFLRVMWIEI